MTNGKLAAALQWVRQTASAGGVSDSELLQRFVAGGDEAAFELLLWRHQRLVFGVCRRVLHNTHDAEDAFQATFLVLARKGRTIGRGESLAAWLYRVAYRCALTVRARQARREQALMPDRDAVAADDPTRPAERNELRAVLDEELNRLPEQFRAPAVLCYLAGKTVDEAAEHLGCPRGTVASRLARARERLRVRLSRRGVMLPATAAALALGEATAGAAPDGLVRLVMTRFQLHATGQAATGTAVAVANKVVRAMFLRKMLIASTVLALCAGVLLVAGGLAVQAVAQLPDDRPAVAAPAQPVAFAQAGQESPKANADVNAQAAPLLPAQEYPGKLDASQVIDVRSRVGGVIEKVAVKLGDTVKRGDPLFEIDAKAAQLALQQAEANRTRAEAKSRLAAATLQRIKNLFASGAVGQYTLDERTADVAAAEEALKLAQVELAQARLKLDETRIAAPINGRVSRLTANVGDVIGGNDKSPILATIIRVDPIALNFDMDERTFVRYEQLRRAGKIAGINLHVRVPAADEQGFPHEAKFAGFAPTVNATTGAIAVRGSMANPQGEFLPGMSVRVRVTFSATAPAKH